MRRIDPRGRIRYGNHTLTVEQRWAELPVGLVRDHGRLHVFYGSAEIVTLIVGDMPHPKRAR
jgi:hypothetical protein